MKLEDRTSLTVKKLERYERNWHIFKAALYVIVGVGVIFTNIYTYNHLLDNSDKNRRLLRCTVITLTNPDSNPQVFRINLQTCLDNTR